MTFEDTNRSTCFAASVAGCEPSNSPDGTDLFGREAVRVSRSVAPEPAKEQMTLDIYGRHGFA